MKKLSLLVAILVFVILNVSLHFFLLRQVQTLREASQTFILFQDYNTLKNLLLPSLQNSVKKITILKNDHIEFELGNSNVINVLVNVFDSQLSLNTSDKYKFQIEYSLGFILIWQLLILSVASLTAFATILFVEQQDRKNKVSEMAQKLAHDIRSPISTLNLISVKIENEDIKDLQLSVVKQINQIADELLKYSQNSNQTKIKFSDSKIDIHSENVDFTEMLKNLQKEYIFKSIALKQIVEFNISSDISKYKTSKQLVDTAYPIINNLIQNSIEATSVSVSGLIEIKVFLHKNCLVIQIIDNGKGMSKEFLSKLGHSKISHGKNNDGGMSGNGIALYNAKSDLNKYGAKLNIQSELGKGTKVELIFS
ncbi:MAG: sensor histidine kinase [Pseudobdellovibrio sp.]